MEGPPWVDGVEEDVPGAILSPLWERRANTLKAWPADVLLKCEKSPINPQPQGMYRKIIALMLLKAFSFFFFFMSRKTHLTYTRNACNLL